MVQLTSKFTARNGLNASIVRFFKVARGFKCVMCASKKYVQY